MSVTVTKNSQESAERLIARFNKKVQQSRILVLARERRYRRKELTPKKMKEKALMREKYRAQRQKAKFM